MPRRSGGCELKICSVFLAICSAAFSQSFESPKQQIDFYGGGSYRVGVDGASVIGTQVRVNTGKYLGIGGYYNFSREASFFGVDGAGHEVTGTRDAHDYGGAVEIHAASRVQPYIVGTLGWLTLHGRGTSRDYIGSAVVTSNQSHLAYGGGVGVRYHFNRRCAVFVESRLLRTAVSGSDYWVRGTVGLSVTLP